MRWYGYIVGIALGLIFIASFVGLIMLKAWLVLEIMGFYFLIMILVVLFVCASENDHDVDPPRRPRTPK